ncbi:MAG: leucine-rich repeat domain-containing protein [Tenericutes bacterium]|jgi:hypothetical protein|nr:leucine-rich repeat domain-containing protein [Mycoplasmatota bacterium]
MIKKTKRKLTFVLLIFMTITLILTLVGLSYSFFKVIFKGKIVNTAITNNLHFAYTENACSSNYPGIGLVNQMPIADNEGINQNDCGSIFDFNINANTTSSPMNYTITAKITSEINIDLDNIKIYLATVEKDKEIQTESTYMNGEVAVLDNFYNLKEDSTEKIIYTEQIKKGEKKYNKDFRFKIWLSENMILYDNSDPNNIIDNRNQSFTIKINVYAEAVNTNVVGSALEWILFKDSDTGVLKINNYIDNLIKNYQTPENIVRYFFEKSLGNEPFIHYFKGDLRTELDWYWLKINNQDEIIEEELLANMPIIMSLFDEGSDDFNFLNYSLVKEFNKMTINPTFVIPNIIIYPDGVKYKVKAIEHSHICIDNLSDFQPTNFNVIEELVISEGIEEIGRIKYPFTSISDLIGPFMGCSNLTNVYLPSTLKKIGNNAFFYTNIQKINLPYGLKEIGPQAFYNINLTNITIPSTVKKIGEGTYNSDFEQGKINKLFFTGKSNLTTIGGFCFDNNNLVEVFIPASVIEIEPNAFSNNPNLKKIIIERADDTDLILGSEWNGGAEVIFKP